MYDVELKKLAPLESFDADLFNPCSKEERGLCNLIISFALIFNDLKDTSMALRFVKNYDSRVNPEISPEKGQQGGLFVHLLRIEAGIMKELMVLIENNTNVIESSEFIGLTKKLSLRARECWNAVVSIALERTTTHPMGKFLLFVRNKVAFHYDPKEIARGYKLAFIENDSDMIPYVSRGNSMPESRFYFADCAVEKYLLSGVDEEISRDFTTGRASLFDEVNIALYEIITKFVNHRKYAWRKVE